MNKPMLEQLKEEILKDWNEGREIYAINKINDLDEDYGHEIISMIKKHLSLIESERFDRLLARSL